MTKKTLDDLSDEELLDELARRRAGKHGTDVSAFEDRIEEFAEGVKQTLLDNEIATLPPEDGSAKPCPRCGRKVRVRRRGVKRSVRTRSGELTLRRNYHQSAEALPKENKLL